MSANSNQEDTIWEIGLGMMCKVDIEHFLRQHFVGKQFAHDPDAPDHYAVFTDGTAVYAINSESGENCPMNMRHLADAGVIERAWHEEEYVESYHSDTYTQLLVQHMRILQHSPLLYSLVSPSCRRYLLQETFRFGTCWQSASVQFSFGLLLWLRMSFHSSSSKSLQVFRHGRIVAS